jgi:molecular chaperone HscB
MDIPAELSTLPAYGFDLDPRSLRNTMLTRQRDLHPDRYASQGAKIVDLARELSGIVNEAYAVLADPLKRAEYIVRALICFCIALPLPFICLSHSILRWHHTQLSANALGVEESDSLTDPVLLAEILEAREEVEMATSQEDIHGIADRNAG